MMAVPLDRRSIACLIYQSRGLVKVETNKTNRIEEGQSIRTEKKIAVCYKTTGVQSKERARWSKTR